MGRKSLETAVRNLTFSFHARTALLLRDKPVLALVPVSGGKDSQTCLRLAIERFGRDNVMGLFCDTQFEHPDTYEHVRWMAEHYGVQIVWVSDGSVEEKSLRYGRFPSFASRHCTDELKIRPTRLFAHSLVLAQGFGFEVWYGMRSDESPAREKRYRGKTDDDLYWPHEVIRSKYPKYLGKLGIRFRLPVLRWSRDEIFDYLAGEEHPHYALGFDRVGCFPCLAASDGPKLKAFNSGEFGAEQYRKVIRIASIIGKPVFDKDNAGNGCAVCSL